jgi:hypothetical protein
MALLLGIWVLASLCVPHRDLAAEAIRKQGFPLAMSEVDAYYPSVPAAENAAVIYSNAFAWLTNVPAANGPVLSALPPIGQRLSPDEVSELKVILEENVAALRLLHSVPACARSRYNVRLADGFNALLPHLAKTRSAAALLSSEGLMHASEGDADNATRAFLAAGRLAESLADEPTIVSQFVRYADWAILLPRLERALSLTTFTEGQLASLQKAVEAAERPRAMVRAMAVERATGYNVITDRKTLAALLRQQGWGRAPAGFFTAAATGIYGATGLQQKERDLYCATMASHIAALELPYPQRAAAGQQAAVYNNPPNRFYILCPMLLPALVKVHSREANHVASARVAAAALAVERFRLAHTNTLPQSLALLTPAWCEKTPADPFDGKPLRLKTKGGNYAIYSIGSDGQDDDGVSWDPVPSKVPQDTAILVKRP